jgi:activator of 2-hydroxyglutaryl-CoA dehydratase
VKVLPQGSGAFFAETLTESGFVKKSDKYKKLFGILDVGYRTTDYILFENGQFINDSGDLSNDTGMRSVLEKLQSYIKQEYDREELEYLAPLLKGQMFDYRGETLDLNPIVTRLAKEHIRKRIEPEVLKRWEGRLNRFHKIIICGGGAHFFRDMPDFLKDHQKQIYIPDDPEMINAAGFCRYGAMQEALETHIPQ